MKPTAEEIDALAGTRWHDAYDPASGLTRAVLVLLCEAYTPDPERASRATRAMLKMGKLDIAALRSAADGVPAT